MNEINIIEDIGKGIDLEDLKEKEAKQDDGSKRYDHETDAKDRK